MPFLGRLLLHSIRVPVYLTSYKTVHTGQYNFDSHDCCTLTIKSNLYFITTLASIQLVKSPWQEPFTCTHVSSCKCYCMIMNNGCKLPHDFSLHITAMDFIALSSVILLQDWLTEEWICRMSWVVKL